MDKLLKECFLNQSNLNEYTYKKFLEKNSSEVQDSQLSWVNSGFNYTLAALEELGEAIKELKYHWWKKGVCKKYDLYMELVDVFHFLISSKLVAFYHTHQELDYITLDNSQELVYQYFDIIGSIPNHKNTPEFTTVNDKIQNGFVELSENISSYNVLDYFYDVCNSVGLSTEELCKLYLGKNALNQFRQNNGYSEGTYKFKSTDNEVMTDIVLKTEYSDQFNSVVYSLIQDHFSEGN